MEWTKLLGLCVLAASMTMFVRQMNQPISAMLAIAVGMMALYAALPQIGRFADEIKRFLSGLGLDGMYYSVMLRAMGIALITQMTVGVCMEMGASSIAGYAEFCGRVAMMGVAVPVFMQLAELAVGMLS